MVKIKQLKVNYTEKLNRIKERLKRPPFFFALLGCVVALVGVATSVKLLLWLSFLFMSPLLLTLLVESYKKMWNERDYFEMVFPAIWVLGLFYIIWAGINQNISIMPWQWLVFIWLLIGILISIKRISEAKNLAYLLAIYIVIVFFFISAFSLIYDYQYNRELGYLSIDSCTNSSMNSTNFFQHSGSLTFPVGNTGLCPHGAMKTTSFLQGWAAHLLFVVIIGLAIDQFKKMRERKISKK